MFGVDQIALGIIVAGAEELLKNPFIKFPFEKYPKITQWILSIVATAVYASNQGKLIFGDYKEFLVNLFGVIVTSYIVYKTILKK